MRSVSKRQKLHDPQAVCSVTSFTARPLLRVGGKDKGTRFLSFVDAMLGFKHLLTDEDLGKAASLCTSMRGQLRSRFIVLSDDKPLPPLPLDEGSVDILEILRLTSPSLQRLFARVPVAVVLRLVHLTPEHSFSL